MKQTVDGQAITYTLDLAAPLVTVLAQQDAVSSTHYVYALGTRPLAQYGPHPSPPPAGEGEWAYLLPDALGSVRQLADADGTVTLAQAYQPYGSLLESAGSGSSVFGYAGEQTDTTGLIYLRARYYDSGMGRFPNKDIWAGNVGRPDTLHGYTYAGNNPIFFGDPSGMDYIWDIDRYTCNDSHAVRGYVYHYNMATGTWGAWPCIADASRYHNVAPEGSPSYLHPSYGFPVSPPAQSDPQRPPQRPSPPFAPRDGYSGYFEGWMWSGALWCGTFFAGGEEVVYDFVSMPPQRARFRYKNLPYWPNGLLGEQTPPGFDSSGIGTALSAYAGYVQNFTPGGSIEEYGGRVSVGSFGLGTPIIEVGFGASVFNSPDSRVWGGSQYHVIGVGINTLLPVSASTIWMNYEMQGEPVRYGTRTSPNVGLLAADILWGTNSPTLVNFAADKLRQEASLWGAIIAMLNYYGY